VPDDFTPPRYRTVTRSAILAAYPHLGYLADPAQPVREPSEYEAAVYENRRSDPEWADLYRLVAEGDAFAARVKAQASPEPLLPAPAAADPEPAGDPAQPGENVSPQPEAPEPAADEAPQPDATAVIDRGDETQVIGGPGPALTKVLDAVQDDKGEQA
jgi:hypothetical protein